MTWMDVLIRVIDSLTELLLAAVIPYVGAILSKKMKNDKAVEYMRLAEKYLTDAVALVKQTFVDSLKAEGRFDADAQKEAFSKAKDIWLEMMSEEMKSVVLKEVGDFETWATAKLEAAVVEGKK